MQFPTNLPAKEVNVGDVFQLRAGEQVLVHFTFTADQYAFIQQDVSNGHLALFNEDQSLYLEKDNTNSVTYDLANTFIDQFDDLYGGSYYAYFSSSVDSFFGIFDDFVVLPEDVNFENYLNAPFAIQSNTTVFTQADVDLAVSAALADVMFNLDGIDISSSSHTATFSKTKVDYTVLSFDKKITGNALANTITSGSASISISAADGNDTITSGFGNDTLDGGNGNDKITAGDGNNVVTSGKGDDSIYSGAGNDKIDAGDGNDLISADEGVNTVTAGAGDDSIYSGAGNDKIDGGDGNDGITAGDGNNTVTGGKGLDSIFSGSGNDKIDGGDDADTINAADGLNTVTGGKGADSITTGAGNDKIDAGTENDTVISGDGNDTIFGGAGSDSITAGDGNDSVDGGADNDFIDGGASSDTLTGGAGNDTINGGDGNDKIDGRDGVDRLISGLGADTLTGGADSDTFVLGLDLTSVKTVTDFKTTFDKLVFTDSLTPTVLDASHFVTSITNSFVFTAADSFGFNSKTGALFHDLDGSGGADAVQVALLGKVPLIASDILI